MSFGDPDVDSLSNSGAGYVFEADEDGVWSEIQKIVPSDRDNEDFFGESVAISGHTIFAGAWQQDYDELGGTYSEDAGAGYFFSAIVCEPTYVDQDITLCFGDSLIVGDTTYYESGMYIDTLLTVEACDSIVSTNLTINELIEEEQEVFLCFGEVYEIGDNVYEETGTYVDTLLSMMGCDSIVFTVLEIEEELFSEQEFTLCFGESITVGESTYDETGFYEDVFEGESGCDSTVYTVLTVLPEIDVTIEFEDVITLVGGDPAVETTTFQWVTCPDYEAIDGATEQTFTATENGEYAVIITDGDCADTSECVTVAGVGIKANSIGNIELYPNPSNGQFTIQLPASIDQATLVITNQLGEVVYQTTISKTVTDLNLEQLANGTYFLILQNGDSRQVEKMTIQH